MSLRHLHVPGVSSYAAIAKLQERLVRRLLQHKAEPSKTSIPAPTIITAEFSPVYTCGRRERGTVTAEQEAFLRYGGKADFFEALRGGQTTFHGPGQLVSYPILDLKRHELTARCYVNTLEGAVMDTCAFYGIETTRTENPGVWVDQDRKICAVGVHLRRNVSSHGIGLNINTDLWWFNRIVACGLEDKRATNFVEMGVADQNCESVGKLFVDSFAKRVHGIEQVETITADQLEQEPV